MSLEDYTALIERHQEMVFRMLARLTGEREGLDDLAQEVFLRLVRALPHFRERSKLSTFIYRVVVNVVNDEWLRRQQERRTVALDDEFDLAHPAPGPADLLERDRAQMALQRSLARLDLRDRAILALFYQEGKAYKEIAEILELPIGTVKTHLHRARERLKLEMKAWTTSCKT